MNKKESSAILLACRKHGLSLSIRKEGEKYLVTFKHKLEIACFEAAKLITNALILENRYRDEMKQQKTAWPQTHKPLQTKSRSKRRSPDRKEMSMADRAALNQIEDQTTKNYISAIKK